MTESRETREVAQAADAVGHLLAAAVAATVDDPTPDVGRGAAQQLVAVDERAAPEHRGGPAQLMGMLTLVHWLGLVRAEQPDADRVADVLGWVGESLGKRYAARARYVSGALVDDAAAMEVHTAQQALQEEFLPALVWLAAGAVARYGGGDVEWLLELDRRSPATYLTGR